MKTTMTMLVAGAGLVLALPLHAIDRGNEEAGRELAENQCIACHAVDGDYTNPEWPKLAGQHADYLFHSLQQYQDGTRDNALMANEVENLSTQDMRDLATFYSNLDGDLYTPSRD